MLFTILNLACGGSQGFYDLPDESYLISPKHFSMDSRLTGISEQPVGLRLPTGLQTFRMHRDLNFAYEKGQATQKSRGRLERDNRRTVESLIQCSAECRRRSGASFLQIHLDYHLKQFAA